MNWLLKNKKIFIILIFSYLLTAIINNTIFFPNIPKINQEKIKRNINIAKYELTILKNKISYQLFTKKIDYKNQFYNEDYKNNDTYFSLESAPTLAPTITINYPTNNEQSNFNNEIDNVITPTKEIISPTIIEDKITIIEQITPKITKIEPTITKYITKKPTLIPTTKISKPTNNLSNNNVEIISNPFSQPYYNPSKAYLCYNNEKFIEVYANNLKPDNCYSNIKKYLESQMTSVKILGKSISVHKQAYPAFNAVSLGLEKNPVAKKYKINTIGAYVFRCNVNATKGDKFDTCNPDCKLSAHSFGIAVDINWEENCNGCDNYNIPIEIVEIFEKYGFRWGGRYKKIFGATIDAMHFEYMYDLCKDIK